MTPDKNLQWYYKEKEKTKDVFVDANLRSRDSPILSPSKRFQLHVGYYNEHCSRGTIKIANTVVADIKTTSPKFLYQWITKNNIEYLLCAEGTEGYSVVNLESKKVRTYIDHLAQYALGFIWNKISPNSKNNYIAVQGWLWAVPTVRVYKFCPEESFPLPVIKTFDSAKNATWLDDYDLEVNLNGKFKLFNLND